MYMYKGLDLRTKVTSNFCEIATHFGGVILNCELYFATYLYFHIIYTKCV